MLKINCYKILKKLFVFLGIFLIFFLGILMFQDNAVISNERGKVESFTVQEIAGEINNKEGTPVGKDVEFVFSITDEPVRDRELMFYVSHHWVDVWLGEEIVYTLKSSDELSFIKTPGSKWICIPLLEDDKGKDLKIVLTPVYENNIRGTLELYLGSSLEIYKYQFERMLPTIILCVVNILIGTILVFAAAYYKNIHYT